MHVDIKDGRYVLEDCAAAGIASLGKGEVEWPLMRGLQSVRSREQYLFVLEEVDAPSVDGPVVVVTTLCHLGLASAGKCDFDTLDIMPSVALQ